MITTSKLSFAILIATVVMPGIGLASPRVAQEANSQIMVPTPSPGGGISGCWSADRNLYGYELNFCIQPGGRASYTITGSGLHCHARLSWTQTWGGYAFNMSRTSCGHGVDWSADSFTCTSKGGGIGEATGRMPVPSYGARLDCKYWPAVWGYIPTRFSAHRT